MNRLPTPEPGTPPGSCPFCACGTALNGHVLPVQWPPTWPLLLSVKQVAAIAGLSRSTIYRKEAEGNFPQRVRIGPGMVRWRLPEILNWEANPEADEYNPEGWES